MKKLIILITLILFFTNAYSIEKHERNYVLHTFHNSDNKELFDDDERLHEEIVYQISIEQDILPWLWLSYTQRSYWQVYNVENSRQFRENNYNPKLFIRLSPQDQSGDILSTIDFGYEHKSNGQTEPKSRSYDRLFITEKYNYDLIFFEFKYWEYLLEEQNSKNKSWRKESSSETIGDFYIKVGVQIENITVEVKTQRTKSFTAGNNELIFEMSEGNLAIMGYYFKGYGDSLIDYNRIITRYGLGLSVGL